MRRPKTRSKSAKSKQRSGALADNHFIPAKFVSREELLAMYPKHDSDTKCQRCGLGISHVHYVGVGPHADITDDNVWIWDYGDPITYCRTEPYCMAFCAHQVAEQVGGVVLNERGEIVRNPNVIAEES
jgi:hypothetical protein